MREIKFRVWDKDEKLMKEVDSINFPLAKPNGKDITAYNQKENYHEWIYDYELMQYTGLKDIEGNEIYEGDIVEITSMNILDEVIQLSNNAKFIGEVIFCDGSFVVDSGKECKFLFREIDEVRIIGNVYENKELISN